MPAGFAPELSSAVTAVFDEGKKFAIGYRCASEAKGFDFDGMRPFLVVESKRKIRCRTDKESSPGNFGITRQRTGGIVWGNFIRHEIRCGVGKGLPGICQRFGMHAFMERGQQVKVKLFRCELGSSVDIFNGTIENLVHIAARILGWG